jgi:hypothetical protein
MHRSTRSRLGAALLGVLLVAGCAFFNPAALPLGMTQADVVATLGRPPTAVHTTAGGTRYEYATGPYGKFTWMLDFDAAGTLRQTRQVLTEAQFNAIQAGMTVQELRLTLGRPGDIRRIERQKQNVWAYRYDGPFCLLFLVGVGDDGRVVDTAYVPDPMCEFEPHGVAGRW